MESDNNLNQNVLLQHHIRLLQTEKEQLDDIYNEFCNFMNDNPHVIVRNNAEFEELYQKMNHYKNEMNQIANKMRHLLKDMRTNGGNLSSSLLDKEAEEDRQINEIIRPFLLPILLRSFVIQNASLLE